MYLKRPKHTRTSAWTHVIPRFCQQEDETSSSTAYLIHSAQQTNQSLRARFNSSLEERTLLLDNPAPVKGARRIRKGRRSQHASLRRLASRKQIQELGLDIIKHHKPRCILTRCQRLHTLRCICNDSGLLHADCHLHYCMLTVTCTRCASLHGNECNAADTVLVLVCSYAIMQELHRAWRRYAEQLLSGLEQSPNVALSLDLHGAACTVVNSKHSAYAAVTGIICKASAAMWHIITPHNEVRSCPRNQVDIEVDVRPYRLTFLASHGQPNMGA